METDDIVTRLRGYALGNWCCSRARDGLECPCVPFWDELTRAADEIERLREELKDTRHMFLRLTQIVKTVLPMLNTKEFLELGKLFAEFEAGNDR
jgi:hypothetical protein